VIWMGLGLVVYFAYSRRHSVLGNAPDPDPAESTPLPTSVAARE